MIPQPKSDAIIGRLNAISQYINRKPYIFELHALKKDANKLLGINPVEANIILGAIASLEEDIETLHKFHSAALYASNNSRFALYQYAISLSNANLLDESYEYLLKAYNAVGQGSDLIEDIMILDSLLGTSYHLNKNDDYEKYKSMLIKLKADFIDPDDFAEDHDRNLDTMISRADTIMEQNEHLITKPDPDLMREINELIEGVELP